MVQWLRMHRIVSTILIVVAVLLFALFGPVRSYYNSVREGQVMQLKYDEVKALNSEIEAQRDSYMSEEGIEDAARKLGYVRVGETGETGETGESAENQVGVDPTTEGSYADKRNFQTKLLDFLFGFNPEVTWDNV